MDQSQLIRNKVNDYFITQSLHVQKVLTRIKVAGKFLFSKYKRNEPRSSPVAWQNEKYNLFYNIKTVSLINMETINIV